MNKKQLGAVIAAVALFCATGYLGAQSAQTVNASRSASVTEYALPFSAALSASGAVDDFPDTPFLAELDISGEIGPTTVQSAYVSGGYDHDLYMDLLDQLMDNSENKGVLLYIDSPGGTVYESDELYLKLLEYKETTKRPVYAYFAAEACSGGYYIAMAADEIYANRNAWTGSIGVIISLLNYKELSEKIGVRSVDITSGRNKTMGSGFDDLTDEQREILQSMVNEAYAQFVDIVAAGRKLERERVLELADGRIYTAQQALDLKLIDHIAGEESAVDEILKKCGLEPDAEIYLPARESAFGFLNSFLYRAAELRPKSELELFRELVNDKRNGALMYYAG